MPVLYFIIFENSLAIDNFRNEQYYPEIMQ